MIQRYVGAGRGARSPSLPEALLGAYVCCKCSSVVGRDQLGCPLCGATNSLRHSAGAVASTLKPIKARAEDLRFRFEMPGRGGMGGPGGFSPFDMDDDFDNEHGSPRRGPHSRDFDDNRFKGSDRPPPEVMAIDEIVDENVERFSTGFDNLDATLGGGFVLGSAILCSGDNGLGKSTLWTQVHYNVAKQRGRHSVLYACGEESAAQQRIRLKRLGLIDGVEKVARKFTVLPGTSFEYLLEKIEETKPILVTMDSLSTFQSEEFPDSAAGGPRQTAYISQIAHEHAQEFKYCLVFICHVTKSQDEKGNSTTPAGSKAAQHHVDVVMQGSLYKKAPKTVEFNCPVKNRFGRENIPSYYTMSEETGLLTPFYPEESRIIPRSRAVGLSE